jgi:hypothetical protein
MLWTVILAVDVEKKCGDLMTGLLIACRDALVRIDLRRVLKVDIWKKREETDGEEGGVLFMCKCYREL